MKAIAFCKECGSPQRFKVKQLLGKQIDVCSDCGEEIVVDVKKHIVHSVRSFLTSIHMKLIRLVACGRPLICGTHFVGGIKLHEDVKNAYIWDCHFDGLEMATHDRRKT